MHYSTLEYPSICYVVLSARVSRRIFGPRNMKFVEHAPYQGNTALTGHGCKSTERDAWTANYLLWLLPRGELWGLYFEECLENKYCITSDALRHTAWRINNDPGTALPVNPFHTGDRRKRFAAVQQKHSFEAL
jgi:hypothetical protein